MIRSQRDPMKRLSLLFILMMAIVSRGVNTANDAALNDLIARARQGDTDAQLSLAVQYRDGKGIEKDLGKAMHWAHIAADHGNAPAMDFLGYAYLTGLGAERNAEIAFGYFHAAADGDCARGAFNLGLCYFGAQGVDQDIGRGLAAWRKGADLGDGVAAAEAAMVYLSGEGVPADPPEALRLATRAADLGDPAGMVVLGEIQFESGKFEEARATWQKASRSGRVGKTGQPTQPSGDMSAQEASDLLKLTDFRRRKSEPGVFAYVDAPHIHQGYNNCGATSAAMLARFQSAKLGAWDFKRLCHSPVGTGTDWSDLMAAAEKIGLHWRLVTFAPDDNGFKKGTTFLRSELDAGRPIVIDFNFHGPEYPGGVAGHTLDVAGYVAAEDLYILRNPAIASPGLELMTAEDLKRYWQSNSYSGTAHDALSRPAIVIDTRPPDRATPAAAN